MRFTATLQGPESIAGAQALREARAQKTQWPYPWSYPPPGATRVTAGADSSGTIETPGLNLPPVQGLAYTVDEGFQFALTDIVVCYINNGQPGVASPGDFLWSLDVNLPVGITTFQGSPLQGLSNVDIPLGSIGGPWPMRMPEFFQSNDCIRSKFVNIAVGVGAPNYFKTMLLGWKWPATV